MHAFPDSNLGYDCPAHLVGRAVPGGAIPAEDRQHQGRSPGFPYAMLQTTCASELRRSWYAFTVPLPQKAPPGDPGAPATDDVALVALVAQANRAALGALYDRHAPSLLAVAIRMLRSEREAQDLLHDVFLEVWEHAREYDATKATVRTWLFVRLRSRALDRLGRAERNRTQSLDSEATFDLRETAAIEAVDSIAVKQALAQLPQEVREVLDLTYFAGQTAREIGELTGVPVGTVKSRLARGLAALGALLRAEKEQSDES